MSHSSDAQALHHAFTQARNRPGQRFELDPRLHGITGDQLPTRLCHVSNNDHGEKPILFDIDGAQDFVLEGNGATLHCGGPVLPIRIGNSRRVTIRNITLDWIRPYFTQADVLDAAPGQLEFRFDPSVYPLEVRNEKLVAIDPYDQRPGRLWNLLPFDAARQEVSSPRENWHLSNTHRATRLGPDHIRLEAAFPECYAPGTPIVLMHGDRVAPGLWIEDAQDVVLENVTIHHAPGMGVVAQRSQNLTIHHLRVLPSGPRLFSTWVDAIHMADCEGNIHIRNCELRGQFDDAVNLHARFTQLGVRTGRCSALVHTTHPQHAGPSPATPGAGWAFYLRNSLEQVGVTRVVSVRQMHATTAEVTWADPLPASPEELVGARFHPDSTVEIAGCRFGANRGRGVLINLEHHTTIHHNHFHVSGRGVESIPDANYWWEGSPVRDLAIHDNTFEDCGFGPCGDDQIFLGPELPDGADPNGQPLRATEQPATPCTKPVLQNVRIENNLFIRHRGRLLHAHGVEGLVFRNNEVQASTRHPVSHPDSLIELGAGMGQHTVENPAPPRAG